MNEKQAKNLVESLIFSADEPLSKEKIKKYFVIMETSILMKSLKN